MFLVCFNPLRKFYDVLSQLYVGENWYSWCHEKVNEHGKKELSLQLFDFLENLFLIDMWTQSFCVTSKKDHKNRS